MQKEAMKLNEAFIKFMKTGLPFVTVKMAQTLDGRIALADGESKWISNELSRQHVHEMRSGVDAILTTSTTVQADNPNLGIWKAKGKDPLRVILDSKLSTAADAQVYRNKNVLVFTTNKSSVLKRKLFAKNGIRLVVFNGENLNLKMVLRELGKRQVTKVMVEAGSGLCTAFFKQKLVDKAYFFIAPKVIGAGIPVIGDLGITKLKKALRFSDIELQKFGDDILMSGYPVYS